MMMMMMLRDCTYFKLVSPIIINLTITECFLNLIAKQKWF